MTSQVSICNQALNAIGKDNISSLTEDSSQAIKCLQNYEHVRQSVLSAYPWHFARTTVAMASLPMSEFRKQHWRFAYQQPSDCLKVRRIIPYVPHSWHHDDLGSPFEIEGRRLFTNDDHGYLEYTKDFIDENLFPILFADAFAAALAARICMPLTNNMQGSIGIAQIARATYIGATVWDANQVRDNSDHESEMIEARQ